MAISGKLYTNSKNGQMSIMLRKNSIAKEVLKKNPKMIKIKECEWE
jgi:hypothetical protein